MNDKLKKFVDYVLSANRKKIDEAIKDIIINDKDFFSRISERANMYLTTALEDTENDDLNSVIEESLKNEGFKESLLGVFKDIPDDTPSSSPIKVARKYTRRKLKKVEEDPKPELNANLFKEKEEITSVEVKNTETETVIPEPEVEQPKTIQELPATSVVIPATVTEGLHGPCLLNDEETIKFKMFLQNVKGFTRAPGNRRKDKFTKIELFGFIADKSKADLFINESIRRGIFTEEGKEMYRFSHLAFDEEFKNVCRVANSL
jgi:hypothetical protein